MIDSFARQLAPPVAPARSSRTRAPILIVVDDAATKKQDVRRLAQYMISRGNPAVILAIARENEWGVMQGDHPVKTNHQVTLPDDLAIDEREPELLVRHLRSLEVFVSTQDDEYWRNRIEAEYQNSFQTTLYFLAEPTRPPLLVSIRSEYERLMPLAQQAYRYVCIFYQFGLPLDLELLARSLGRSYDEFIASVYDPASIGVIIDDVLTPETFRFRARSRKIAELMVQHSYGAEGLWLKDLETVVASSLPQNANEVETLRTMLIRLSGRAKTQPVLNPAALKPLFERALNIGMRDSATLHHFALLLLEEEDFESAEKYMSEAVMIIDDPHEISHFKTANRQHLYNSMGMVCARYGLHLEKMSREQEAGLQFEKAQNYFRSARLGQFPNSYPYYSEAWMSYTRARNSLGTPRIEFLAKSLQVLDESEGNVPDDETASIHEMEAKVVQYLGDIPGLKELLESLAAVGNTSAEYLQARLATSSYSEGYDVHSAYAILMAALEKSPNHVPCLRLATRLYRKMHPADWDGIWNLLKRRYDLEGVAGGCGLLFELGQTACQLGRYQEAAKYFEELDIQSTGHPMRSGIVQVVRDTEPRRFTGIVKTVRSRFEAWIRSDVIGMELKCVPLRQKFTIVTGQSVTFSLGLNYIGFLAIDLRPA